MNGIDQFEAENRDTCRRFFSIVPWCSIDRLPFFENRRNFHPLPPPPSSPLISASNVDKAAAEHCIYSLVLFRGVANLADFSSLSPSVVCAHSRLPILSANREFRPTQVRHFERRRKTLWSKQGEIVTSMASRWLWNFEITGDESGIFWNISAIEDR